MGHHHHERDRSKSMIPLNEHSGKELKPQFTNFKATKRTSNVYEPKGEKQKRQQSKSPEVQLPRTRLSKPLITKVLNARVIRRASEVHAHVKILIDPIPVKPLIVFGGTANGIDATILKDDGCNTNVISKDFYEKYAKAFQEESLQGVRIQHSNKGSREDSELVLKNVLIKISKQSYISNFVAAECRYDVILGTPWHVACSPHTDYNNRSVQIGDTLLRSRAHTSDRTAVSSISVKRFRRMLRRQNACLFRVHINQVSRGTEPRPISTTAPSEKLRAILSKYKAVFQRELPHGLPPKRCIEHEIVIDPDAKIPFRRLYQLSPRELGAAREYIADLLRRGVIRPSTSPFGAPLFFAKQPGRPLRAVVDYRALNRITKKNNAPLPRADEMFDRIGGCKYFTKMDLKTGFHQIRVKAEDIEKTAFNTKYGQFEYLVMPMGLCNAPATFQSLMNTVLREYIDIFCVVYVDDILIFSKTLEDHYDHIEKVLTKFKEYSLYVAPHKCEFVKTEIEFLGYIITPKGLKVNPKKINVIQNWPPPKNVTELRSFLGLVQYFRRFIQRFSKIAYPLTNLTRKNASLSSWNDECMEAFELLKRALVEAPVLRAPDFSRLLKDISTPPKPQSAAL